MSEHTDPEARLAPRILPNAPVLAGWVIAALLFGLWGASPGCHQKFDARGNLIKVGRLRLRTFPSGAQVWIDGELKIESTPATLLLPGGRYQLKLQLEGAEALEREITITEGEVREMDLDLPKPPDATITVVSDMEGAQVRINGFVRGTTPLVGAVTHPGPIDMTVVAPIGGRAKSIRALLRIGEQKRIEAFFEPIASIAEEAPKKALPISLPPQRGYLTLGLAPDGLVYDEDGKLLGKTPLVAKAVEPGELTLSLRSLDGHYEKQVGIEVESEKTAVYRFRFTDADQVPGWTPPDAGPKDR